MSTERRGLGRGLSALLGPDNATEGRTVALDAIEPNPYQPRDRLDDSELQELAGSIRTHGLIQPLVVTLHGEGYRLIAGERRWRAAAIAGLTTVPVVVREASPRDMLAVALIENVQRSNLDPVESATAYRRLADEFGLTHAEVAELVGKARTTVTNAVRLLGLEPEIQELIRTGAISEGHGRALLTVDPGNGRVALGRRAAKEHWSVRDLERITKTPKDHGATADQRPPSPSNDAEQDRAAFDAARDPNDLAAVRALEEALGTRVELRRRGAGGSLVVHYYSDEELIALCARLLEAAK